MISSETQPIPDSERYPDLVFYRCDEGLGSPRGDINRPLAWPISCDYFPSEKSILLEFVRVSPWSKGQGFGVSMSYVLFPFMLQCRRCLRIQGPREQVKPEGRVLDVIPRFLIRISL